MTPAQVYASLRRRLRDTLDTHELALQFTRRSRYLIVQGPWQPLVIRWYRSRAANPVFPVRDRSCIAPLDIERTVERLEREAYAPGFTLPAGLVDEVVRHVEADGGRRLWDPHRDCEAVRRIVHDPQLVAVARRYLGVEPVLTESQIYWTLPTPDAQGRVWLAADGGRYHYDVADVRSLTVFVYLTDVDAECGPHVVVRGTQQRRTPAQILRRELTDEEVERRWPDRVQMITGPRGTGWFEDIACYHKQAVGTKVRLLLAILYSIHRGPRPERGGGAPAR